MQRRQDLALVLLALVHGAVLLVAPIGPIIAVGVWWNSNTIAHNFVHKPFFRRAWQNTALGIYQSLLLGIPQTLWRERHLAHHAGRAWRCRLSPALVAEVMLIAAAWTSMAAIAPLFFVTSYVPGYVVGLVLCTMHGHYEHAGAVTTSHYGRVYNWLCFNDGYHVEHHACPGVHWSDLPARATPAARASRWPALLRWLDALSLDGLERVVLHVPLLQRLVIDRHVRAFTRLRPALGRARRVAIVGGGLFPRTVMVVRQVLPAADLVVIEADASHIETARRYLEDRCGARSPAVDFRCERFEAGRPADEFDLVVVPLAFAGCRHALYEQPVAPLVLVHDWWWRRGGTTGTSVSWLLMKRLNLVRR